MLSPLVNVAAEKQELHVTWVYMRKKIYFCKLFSRTTFRLNVCVSISCRNIQGEDMQTWHHGTAAIWVKPEVKHTCFTHRKLCSRCSKLSLHFHAPRTGNDSHTGSTCVLRTGSEHHVITYRHTPRGGSEAAGDWTTAWSADQCRAGLSRCIPARLRPRPDCRHLRPDLQSQSQAKRGSGQAAFRLDRQSEWSQKRTQDFSSEGWGPDTQISCWVRKGKGSQSVVVCVAKYPRGENQQQVL